MTGIRSTNKSKEVCKTCSMGKQTFIPFNKKNSPASEVLVVYSELFSLIEETSIGGSRYGMTFIDDKTH